MKDNLKQLVPLCFAYIAGALVASYPTWQVGAISGLAFGVGWTLAERLWRSS